jgi:hypothetical protein
MKAFLIKRKRDTTDEKIVVDDPQIGTRSIHIVEDLDKEEEEEAKVVKTAPALTVGMKEKENSSKKGKKYEKKKKINQPPINLLFQKKKDLEDDVNGFCEEIPPPSLPKLQSIEDEEKQNRPRRQKKQQPQQRHEIGFVVGGKVYYQLDELTASPDFKKSRIIHNIFPSMKHDCLEVESSSEEKEEEDGEEDFEELDDDDFEERNNSSSSSSKEKKPNKFFMTKVSLCFLSPSSHDLRSHRNKELN